MGEGPRESSRIQTLLDGGWSFHACAGQETSLEPFWKGNSEWNPFINAGLWKRFPGSLAVKESTCNAGDTGLISEDPLEKEMATCSSVLAWEIPWTEELGGPQSMGSQKSRTRLSDQTTTKSLHWNGSRYFPSLAQGRNKNSCLCLVEKIMSKKLELQSCAMWQGRLKKKLHHLSGMCLVSQSCLTLCDPLDCSLPSPSVRGFFRQEYWCGLPYPSLGDLPNSGMELVSPALQVDSLPAEPSGKPRSVALVVQSLSCVQLFATLVVWELTNWPQTNGLGWGKGDHVRRLLYYFSGVLDL